MKAMRKSLAVLVWSGFLILFLAAAFPSPSWSATAKTRMAVIDFEQKAPQEFQGRQIGEIVAEWLITSLVNTGRFEVVERSQLKKILNEQQLGMTGMINQETVAKMGELLGVKVIISGAVIQIGNTYEVNARLISVEDGSILKAEKIRGVGLESIERMMDSLADSIKKDFPLEGYVILVSGRRAMIDLGRINGVEPGMRFFALRKGAPVRHPVTGRIFPGEDVKLGEMSVRNVERESSWAEIIQEEPGIRISAGNLAKQVVGKQGREVSASAPVGPAPGQPSPSAPATAAPPKMTSGKFPGGKILVEWTGMNDLILGDRDGYVTLYLNLGTPESPRYDRGTKLKAGGKEVKVRSPSAPYLVDWNEDGKMDLLVGNGGGYLHLFLNQGSATLAPGVMVQAAGKDLDVGGKASPCVVDWNEDGKKDLVVGNGSGEIFLYLNEGTNEQPIFGKPTKLNGGSLDVGSNSSPDMVDWNGDGKKDLVIGNDDGEIFIFLNKGTNEDPQFENRGDKLSFQVGSDASPQVLNRGPGLNDLLVADRKGEVDLFVNTGSAASPHFSEKKVLKPAKE
jgi:TolB-like protein